MNTVIQANGSLRTPAMRLVESRQFNVFITLVIVINAISLGLETSPDITAVAGTWLNLGPVHTT